MILAKTAYLWIRILDPDLDPFELFAFPLFLLYPFEQFSSALCFAAFASDLSAPADPPAGRWTFCVINFVAFGCSPGCTFCLIGFSCHNQRPPRTQRILLIAVFKDM